MHLTDGLRGQRTHHSFHCCRNSEKGSTHFLIVFFIFLTHFFASWGQPAAGTSVTGRQWGDLGDGRYGNPILCADYSDPDVIRVGSKYYMVASDFHFMGMQMLESDDMVNWRLLTHVYHRIDLPGYDTNERYAGGSWAPSLRYHDGRFWIFFCTPHEGLFMTQAERPEGPWSRLHQVRAVEKWEDPCPFWDDDGQAYLVRSRHGAGPLIVHRMSSDGRALLDEGVTVYTGPVAEGPKMHKLNGYYYLSIPEGGVGTGWQTMLRSRNIYGPYEKRVVLEQGSTRINGPHQGAIVDTPQGAWWFFHFQHYGALGRVVHLQPMRWEDGWPVVGTDADGNGIGEPVAIWTKPVTDGSTAPCLPATSTIGFPSSLPPQWQWNHNPVDTAWSLSDNPGCLTLHALQSNSFSTARNTLTQKVMGYESMATLALDLAAMADGGRAGLVCMGKGNEVLGVAKENGRLRLYRGNDSSETIGETVGGTVYLRLHLDIDAKQYQYFFSSDNVAFSPVDDPFFIDFGHWKGVRFGIYHYNTDAAAGYVNVPWVRYDVTR